MVAITLEQRRTDIHPLVVRVTHWLNAGAVIVMIASGWQIYDASPIFPFTFPASFTLGGWLGGALRWHFAAMWLLMANGLLYLTYGIASGRLRRKLLPIRLREFKNDLLAALRGSLSHTDLSHYNAVQKLLYAGVIALLLLIVLSGLAIWKPVQLSWLTALFGGFQGARLVHFLAMAAIGGFVVIHVVMAMIVPRTILAMIFGR